MGFAFKLDVLGNMAGQLAPINRGLAQTDANLARVGRSAGFFDRAAHGILTIDLASAFRSAADAAMSVVRSMWEVGKSIVDVSAKAQDLDLASRLQLGEGGSAMIRRIGDSFFNTRFDDDLIRQSLLPLANAGVRDETMLQNIATAAADVAVRLNTGEAGFAGATEALGKIALKREISERQLLALGLNESDYLKNLAGLLGTTEKNVKKQIAAGKIAAPTLLSVALDELQKQQGGAIGIAALAGGQTLGASLARLGNLRGNLFEQLDNSPGMKAVQRVLDRFTDILSGPVGARVMQQIGGVFERMFGNLSDQQITDFLDKVPGAVEKVITAVTGLVSGILSLGDAWNDSVTKTPVEAVMRLWGGMISEGLTKIQEEAPKIGRALYEGIIAGIKENSILGAPSRLVDAVGEMASGTIASARRAFQIRSPSVPFVEIGSQLGAGLAVGMEGSVGEVSAAQRAMLAAAMPGSVSGTPAGLLAAAGTAGAGVVIHQSNEYRIDGAGDPEEVRRIVHEQQQISNLALLRLLAVEAAGAEV